MASLHFKVANHESAPLSIYFSIVCLRDVSESLSQVFQSQKVAEVPKFTVQSVDTCLLLLSF